MQLSGSISKMQGPPIWRSGRQTNLKAEPFTQENIRSFSDVYGKKTGKTGSAKSGGRVASESAVADYIRKHPEDRSHVESQVNAGRKVLEKNGAEDISREDMTMEEYKFFIAALMDSIPFDVSQGNTTEIWSITEAGWEQMKNDPDYEAWVLGYTSENRSVKFPAMLAGTGHMCTEKFGASIEEHHGQSVSTGSGSHKSEGNEKSWWQKRHERYEELLEMHMKQNRLERAAQNKARITGDWKDAYAYSSFPIAELLLSGMGTGTQA